MENREALENGLIFAHKENDETTNELETIEKNARSYGIDLNGIDLNGIDLNGKDDGRDR